MKKIIIILSAIISIALLSCSDNFDDGNYYSAKKLTAAQFISEKQDNYSLFQRILERSNHYNLLSTYGTFTVFVPTNEAVTEYLAENGYNTVEDVPLDMCDTISRTHIVDKGAYFTTDYSDGELPQMNMDDRFLVISSDSDVLNDNRLILYVNKRSRIIEKDDSVTNGVVHIINRVLTPSNLFLPDLIEEDTTLQLFSQALKLTGMCDSLTKYIDASYTISDDSVTKGISIYYGSNSWTAKFPEKRYYKYTALVETDEVYNRNGIYTIDDLIAYAKRTYDATFPADAGLYDDDYKNRRNPLNRFISYHLLDRRIPYNDLAPSGICVSLGLCKTDIYDPEAFWETMCPGAMIRFCRPSGQTLYANRKGLKNRNDAGCAGVKVLSASESGKKEQDALNGMFHYIDDILVYSKNVRDKILNCRMRIDATALSPDFYNCGTIIHGADVLTMLKNGYIRNWKTSKETIIGVRSENQYMSSYLANAICVEGKYDVQVKLPTPPPGLYEVRLGYVAGEERDVIQVYLNNEPCGIPIDLRIGSWDPITNWDEDTDDEQHNTAIDKAMRNNGYMKAMDSYGKSSDTNFRANAPESLRRVLTTVQIREDQEYWLRIRQVTRQNEWSFDYIELCPKSIYANPSGEDRH